MLGKNGCKQPKSMGKMISCTSSHKFHPMDINLPRNSAVRDTSKLAPDRQKGSFCGGFVLSGEQTIPEKVRLGKFLPDTSVLIYKDIPK
jgi:hypothetical protein